MYGATCPTYASCAPTLDEIRGRRPVQARARHPTRPQSAHVDGRGGARGAELLRQQLPRPGRPPATWSRPRTRALDEWGFGMASVRFICGTQELHKELEQRLSAFLGHGGHDPVLRRASTPTAASSRRCSAPRTRSSPTSSTTRRSSTASGCARRSGYRYAQPRHGRPGGAAEGGRAAPGAALIVTDGVFSMDGYVAPLREICDLADRYDALVMVDDSHAVGFVGPDRPRHARAAAASTDRVDIVTGTLGKALGGASGGYVAARAEIVELLRQRARPYLFSNTLAPAIVAGIAAGARPARAGGRAAGAAAARTPRCSARWMTEAGLRRCCPASTRSCR